MNAKIISIWGANGSGKTTTAVNLAFALAQRNFLVGVISSNMYYGEMQTVFGCNVDSDRGTYHSLMSGETKNMFVQAGKSAVFVLSAPDKFDAMQLTTVSADSAINLLDNAVDSFDFVIIDGNTELNNPISSIGMTKADKVLIVHKPSVKDCLWYRSMQNVIDLLNLSYKSEHILNGHDKSCDLSAYKSSIGLDFSYELGYVENAKIYANTGQAIVFHDMKQEKAYTTGIQNLATSLII